MTKKEVKELSNTEMIAYLMHTQKYYTVTKSIKRTAEYICQELSNRGVIGDPEALFDEWIK